MSTARLQPAGSGAPSTGFDRRWLALIATTIGSFMTLLDSSIVNVALPGMINDFHSSVAVGQFVVTIYLMALAVVIPVSGFLGEKIGMKRLFMVLLLAFAVSSALCALAWSMPSLILFRALQGLGGGMLQPVSMAIVFTMITPLERGRFMIMLGLPILLAPIIGHTVGGYLTQFVSWRAIFLINVPIGLIDIILAQFLLRETEIRREAKLDAGGFVLAALAFPMLLFALSVGSDSGWGSPVILGLLVLGLATLGGFIVTELRHPEPMLQLRLFANPMFSAAILINFVGQFCFFGTSYVLPLFLQNARGFGAAETGLILFPSGILDFLAICLSGKLYNRFGPKPWAIAGFSILTITVLALSRIDANTPPGVIAAIASLRGLGMGLGMMPVMTMAFNTVPQPLMSRATALQNVSQRVFGAVSTALLTTILILALTLHGAPAGSSITAGNTPVPYLVHAFSDSFLAMAVVAVAGTLLALKLHDSVLDRHLAAEREGGVAAAAEFEA